MFLLRKNMHIRLEIRESNYQNKKILEKNKLKSYVSLFQIVVLKYKDLKLYLRITVKHASSINDRASLL